MSVNPILLQYIEHRFWADCWRIFKRGNQCWLFMIPLYRIYAFETIIHNLYVGGIFLGLFKIGGTQFILRRSCFFIWWAFLFFGHPRITLHIVNFPNNIFSIRQHYKCRNIKNYPITKITSNYQFWWFSPRSYNTNFITFLLLIFPHFLVFILTQSAAITNYRIGWLSS